MAALPEAVRVARTERGMSQRQLAARLNVSQPAICRIERGRNVPKLANFAALVSELGLDPREVL